MSNKYIPNSNYFDLGKETVMKYQTRLNNESEILEIVNNQTTLENLELRATGLTTKITDSLYEQIKEMDIRTEKTLKSMSKQYVKNTMSLTSTIVKINKSLMEALEKKSDDLMDDLRVNTALTIQAEYTSMYKQMILSIQLHKAKNDGDEARHKALQAALKAMTDQHEADVKALNTKLTGEFGNLNRRLGGVSTQLQGIVGQIQQLDAFYRQLARQMGSVT